MSFNSDELQKLSEEAYGETRLVYSVYCGECGYNLKTLPYVGVCPECGNNYNARPLKMEGVFQPHLRELPINDAILLLLCGAFTWMLLRNAFNPFCEGCVFIAMLVVAAGVVCLVRFWTRLRQFFKFRRVEQRIASGEDD